MSNGTANNAIVVCAAAVSVTAIVCLTLVALYGAPDGVNTLMSALTTAAVVFMGLWNRRDSNQSIAEVKEKVDATHQEFVVQTEQQNKKLNSIKQTVDQQSNGL